MKNDSNALKNSGSDKQAPHKPHDTAYLHRANSFRQQRTFRRPIRLPSASENSIERS
jgi:hypothetical protein